jgi:hypothetical protein
VQGGISLHLTARYVDLNPVAILIRMWIETSQWHIVSTRRALVRPVPFTGQ